MRLDEADRIRIMREIRRHAAYDRSHVADEGIRIVRDACQAYLDRRAGR